MNTENVFIRKVAHSWFGVPSACFKVHFEVTIQKKLKKGSDMRNLILEQRVGVKFHSETKTYIAYSKQGSKTLTQTAVRQLNY